MRRLAAFLLLLILLSACGVESEEPGLDLDAAVQARVQQTTAARPTGVVASPSVIIQPTEVPKTQVPLTQPSPIPTIKPTHDLIKS